MGWEEGREGVDWDQEGNSNRGSCSILSPFLGLISSHGSAWACSIDSAREMRWDMIELPILSRFPTLMSSSIVAAGVCPRGRG